MAMDKNRAASHNHGNAATVAMSQWTGRDAWARIDSRRLSHGGCQTMIVKVAKKTKPNQTTRNLAEPRRVDSIFGSGVTRSKIGVGLGAVCAAFAFTGPKV